MSDPPVPQTGPSLEPEDAASSSQAIWAIDVHGHYGTYMRRGNERLTDALHSADADEVVRRARAARVELTVVSPLSGLLPRGEAEAAAGNDEAARIVPRTSALRQWVILHPRQPATFEQADQMLAQPTCVGIKIHPEEHVYAIREYGPALFEFAAERKAVVLSHSGHANSLPADLVDLANRFPEVRLILAHIGCSDGSDRSLQVRAIQKAVHGNVWADTSSAMSLTPGLIEWAVAEVGAERILFGTDTPLYATSMQRARIDLADLSDSQKRLILRDNGAALLSV